MVEAKPGKEEESWNFLNAGRDIVADEPDTKTWYACRVSENTFGIFDTFETERAGRLTWTTPYPLLLPQGPNLLEKDPGILPVELIAVKQL